MAESGSPREKFNGPDTLRAAEVLRPTSCALLLWDLQNGLAGQAPGVAQLSTVWRRLASLAQAHDVPIIRSQHVAPRQDVMTHVERWRISRRTHGENRPEHFMQPGGQDTAWIPGFEPQPDEIVIEKATPSLFFDSPADSRLRARNVQTLVMAGVATDIGIDFTARHAMALGYFPVVVSDGVGSFTATAHEHGMAILRSFTIMVSAEELALAWSAAAPTDGAEALRREAAGNPVGPGEIVQHTVSASLASAQAERRPR